MKKVKRIAALLGVIILVGFYVVTLISAVLATPATKDLFKASLLATLIIPIMIYVYMLIYRLIAGHEEERREERDKGFDEIPKDKKL